MLKCRSADTKLIASWLVGSRDAGSAYEFMQDVAGRLRNRVQLTTDGHKPYLAAVEDAFGADIDYAMLQKLYGAEQSALAAMVLAHRIHVRARIVGFCECNGRSSAGRTAT